MEVRLDGRTALITGGSLGLGKAMAMMFADSGAKVAIVARRQEVLNETKKEIEDATGGTVGAYSCNVLEKSEIEAAHAAAVKDLGSIDILVNNAGTSKRSPFMDLSDEDWEHDITLKLFSNIRFSRLCIPHMKEQKWGRIINSLNTGAKATPAEGGPTAISRAAGMSLTKAMASEYAPFNILVNGLMVGRIDSDQWVQRHKNAGDNKSYDEWIDDFGKDLPMGRIGKAEEYAAVATLLASDHGGYVTGTAINVDGGLCPVV